MNCVWSFNPLPLRTKEETEEGKYYVHHKEFQSASFSNKGRNSGGTGPN
ncbi:hypothetical protein LEP1GSC024_1605 [Leptospira noguchii str. 2001034031]|uniref:Uncharacterized protein n=1 Tax=Leptospira noguchii str. 2001034031 TaxID=1193053 RepID=M6YSZ1_9LEPT|nr:hypothetical protein LEP1GSC024_1605 [Leptospira noguchii str. 2001034031]